MTPKIVTVPYRGLRCRELDCQRPLVMVATMRDTTLPLEADLVALDDPRGCFVIVEGLEYRPPTALGIRAARELGLEILTGDHVYRAHWSGCTKPERFRRG
jgi:hypothetical protein